MRSQYRNTVYLLLFIVFAVSLFLIPLALVHASGDPAVDIEHYRWRNDDGTEVTATGAQTEDTQITGKVNDDLMRLRVVLDNPGSNIARNLNITIQQSTTAGCGSGTAIPVAGSCGSAPFCMIDSQLVAEVDTNNWSGTTDSSVTFVAGKQVENASNVTVNFNIDDSPDEWSEVEYSFQVTGNAVSDTDYFFRLDSPDVSTHTVCPSLQTGTIIPPPSDIPALEQVAYRWFVNTDSTDVGSAAVMNQRIIAPRQGDPFRLRLLAHVYDADLASNATQSTLQISTTTDECDTGFSGETYNDVSSTSGYIQFFDNDAPGGGEALTDNVKDPHHASSSSSTGEDTVINQNYAEGNNNFRNEQSAISETEDGLWDFALVDTGAPPGTRYCFRAVQEFGGLYYSASGGYATGSIPELTTRQRVKIVLRGQVRLRIVRLR